MNTEFISGLYVKFDDVVKTNIHGIIYIALNTLNNKCYIGQTKLDLNTRKSQHMRPQCKTYFSYALKKYNDNFIWSICDIGYSKEELDIKEKYLINHYQSNNKDFGYNLTSGGDGRCDFKHRKSSNDQRALSNKKYYTDLFYKEYNVKSILDYMENNEVTFVDCAIQFNLKPNKLKNFFRKEFLDLYNFYLQRSEKLRCKRTQKGLLAREFVPKKINVDINVILKLLYVCNSFIEIANKLNVTSGIIKNRLQEYNMELYNDIVKKYIKIRNINITNKRYGKDLIGISEVL